ncbi:fluoride efflux transporter CrcB [Mesobacillus foraminis]|uniref:fluoride efflux transporter CrcB n=1 Tax=Mesobacillus foraminis TaxID=279826 RepID=UPI00214B22DA|nr:fluoride efflux transporter CrcB [Mesobacillus foraminis]
MKSKEIIGVGLGGAAGSLLRYSLGVWSLQMFGNQFPYGTLVANLIGSFFLGWLTSRVIEQKCLNPAIASSIGTGLIGSFTTFSTFSIESISLWSSGSLIPAIVYISASAGGGLLLAFTGYALGAREQEKETGGVQL